jgi:hypothetical protein
MKRALLLFSKNLEEVGNVTNKNHVNLLVGMLKPLVAIATSAETEQVNKAAVRQLALLNCEILSRLFGKQHLHLFIEAATAIVDSPLLYSTNLHVVASTMVCLSSFISALGVKLIGVLPKLFPRVLELSIPCSENAEPTRLLHVSRLTLVNATVRAFPQFLSPYIDRVLALLCLPVFQALHYFWGVKEGIYYFSPIRSLMLSSPATFLLLNCLLLKIFHRGLSFQH